MTKLSNTGGFDFVMDDLVYRHETHDDDAFCCLRDESVRKAIQLYVNERVSTELQDIMFAASLMSDIPNRHDVMIAKITNRLAELKQ